MVFVTVGTQKQDFSRIFKLVENSKELQNEEINAQVGYSDFKSEKIKVFNFIDHIMYSQMVENAEIVICHGGVGSIFDALLKKKKVIAVPRLKKYGEHVNDHQEEICEALEKEKNILWYKDGEDFDEYIRKIRMDNFLDYIPNNDFLEKLKKEI
jgi:UDP-N-acetylglucosamine transferase subunit ALG13